MNSLGLVTNKGRFPFYHVILTLYSIDLLNGIKLFANICMGMDSTVKYLFSNVVWETGRTDLIYKQLPDPILQRSAGKVKGDNEILELEEKNMMEGYVFFFLSLLKTFYWISKKWLNFPKWNLLKHFWNCMYFSASWEYLSPGLIKMDKTLPLKCYKF